MKNGPSGRFGWAAALASLLPQFAGAQAAPEPPARPSEFGGAGVPDAAVSTPIRPEPRFEQTTAQPGDTATCLARLTGAGWTFEAVPQPAPGRPECAVDTPVRLFRLVAAGAAKGVVQFPDRPILACRYAETLDGWVGGIVTPVIGARMGVPLAAIRTGPGTDCRTRDHIAGARISAHASGLALDIAGFDLADGRSLAVKPTPSAPAAWPAVWADLRIAACGWFTTVLGPGSDAFHTDHVHLDIQTHGSSDRYRICQ